MSDRRPGAVEAHLGITAVHVHGDFAGRRRRDQSPGARRPTPPRTAPVPHASVMPAPRSCTRMVMASRSGPGSMISRLTSGTRRAERLRGRRRRRRRRPRRRAGCRAEVGDRAHRVDAERRPSRPAGRWSVTAPMSTLATIVRRRGPASNVDGAHAGVGGDRARRRAPARARAPTPGRGSGCRCRSSRRGCRRRCTATMPTSAAGAARCWPTSRPSAPMPRRRSHSARASAAQAGVGQRLVVEQRRGSRCRGRGAW